MEFPDFGLPTYSFTVFSSLRSVYVDAGLPVACVLNLQGDQGTGKSTLAKRFVSLYNVHNAIADAYDADSTFASMRDALSSTRDHAVLFDDICKSSDPLIQRKRRRDAANLVRMATNGLPITWKSGGKTIHANCNACLVITGEVDFDQPSDLTRCVTVIISQQMTNGSAADRSDAATALAGFLQWFSEHYEEEKTIDK